MGEIFFYLSKLLENNDFQHQKQIHKHYILICFPTLWVQAN